MGNKMGLTEKKPYKNLGQLCSRITDGTHQTPIYRESGVVFISAKNIKNGNLDFGDVKHISQEEHAFLTRQSKPTTGDILLTKSGSLGDAALIPELEFEFSIFESLALIKVKRDEINPNYLKQYLCSDLAKRYFSSITSGVAVKHLHLGDLRKLKVFTPPLSVQALVADLLTTWDTAIKKNERLIAAKESIYSTYLTTLIHQSDKQKQWHRIPLGEIVTIRKGQQLNVTDMIDDGKYYALNGGTRPSGRTDKWNTPENTITISEGGNSCGYVNYNSEKFWCGGHCYSLTAISDLVEVRFLYHFLKGRQARLMALRAGSGLPNIQKNGIESFVVNIAPLPEQQRIASVLDTAREEIAHLENLVDAYKVQKRGLMQKLLTGQWRVNSSKEAR